jgi:hypothetical protein
MSWLTRNACSAFTESTYERTVRGLFAAASSASCHDVANAVRGPLAGARALRRCPGLRRVSPMLVTDMLTPSRRPVRPASVVPYPYLVRQGIWWTANQMLYRRYVYVVR